MTSDNAITVRGANKRYGDFAALDDVDFVVPKGSLTALLGPSGSGKSTLMAILGCLDRPTGGHYFFEGVDPFFDIPLVPLKLPHTGCDTLDPERAGISIGQEMINDGLPILHRLGGGHQGRDQKNDPDQDDPDQEPD